jgi:hypothetical protein
MKLTLKWSDTRGEGFADAKEVAALMHNPDITTLDFLQDCMAGVNEIYNAALDRVITQQQAPQPAAHNTPTVLH